MAVVFSYFVKSPLLTISTLAFDAVTVAELAVKESNLYRENLII